MECPTCGNDVEILQTHHIVPRSAGGSDRPGNLISLCEDCHGKIHSRNFVHHKRLVQLGLERARSQGRIGGRPRAMTSEQVEEAKVLLSQGVSQEAVARSLGTSASTLRRELKRPRA